MKGTDNFKKDIQEYLEQYAKTDELFAIAYFKPGKNIDDCITYILNTVQKSKCNGCTDKEVYGMAVHYYVEDNIEIGKPINCHVVVNHVVELTEDEKQQARKDAIQDVYNQAYNKVRQPQQKRKTPQASVKTNEPTLFDL